MIFCPPPPGCQSSSSWIATLAGEASMIPWNLESPGCATQPDQPITGVVKVGKDWQQRLGAVGSPPGRTVPKQNAARMEVQQKRTEGCRGVFRCSYQLSGCLGRIMWHVARRLHLHGTMQGISKVHTRQALLSYQRDVHNNPGKTQM